MFISVGHIIIYRYQARVIHVFKLTKIKIYRISSKFGCIYIYVYRVMGFVQLFIIYLTINIKNIHDKFIKWEDKVKTNDSLKQKKTFSTSKQTRNDNCFNSPLGLKHFAPINFILQFQQSVLVKSTLILSKYNLSTPRTLQW